MAWTTVAAPMRTSPVPNTPGRPVSNVTASALSRDCLVCLGPSLPGARASQLGALADGQQDAVARDDELGAGRRLRAAPAGRVRGAELHPDELDAGDVARRRR